MSDKVFRENEKLRLLVESLKRENRELQGTLSLGMEFTDQMVENHHKMMELARKRIQEEHVQHCAACANHEAQARVTDDGEVTFVMTGSEPWGSN